MAQFRTSHTFDALFVAGLLVLLGVAYLNRVDVNDWWFFTTHHPSAKTEQVATAASLSPTGRRLLERGDPQFTDAATVARACDVERLGCLTTTGQIYVLDDPAKPDQTTVTAAHEMLHLAYRRLSAADKTKLRPSLDQAIAQNNGNGLYQELADQTGDADRLDEAHSLLGTEYTDLSSQLETYYRTYFSNRSQVTAAEQRAE